MESIDDEQILKLFADGDRALMAAEAAQLKRIYAEDYVQSDELGNLSTRQAVIDKLVSGKIRFLSMTSTGRSIRLLRDDLAIIHGSEEDLVEQDGRQSIVRYVYMDVVTKRDGRWQIVASQLARVP